MNSIWMPGRVYNDLTDWKDEDQTLEDAIGEIAEEAKIVWKDSDPADPANVPVSDDIAEKLQEKAGGDASPHEVISAHINNEEQE